MLRNKKYESILAKSKGLQEAIKAKKEKIDIYDCGLYNGMEIILSEMEGREPDYIYCLNDVEILGEPEKPKERVKGGVIKCRSGRP